MANKLMWSEVIKYLKQAAAILLERGEIKPPAGIGYKTDEHEKIVKLAKELREAAQSSSK